MVEGPEFRFYFKSAFGGNYYYVDTATNNVLTTPDPVPLVSDPSGWDEMSIMMERNRKYFGLERSFTIPISFINDGARILKFLYYTEGISSGVILLIEQQKIRKTATTHEFYYEYLYEGEVDFSTFTDEGFQVTCTNVEGGASKVLKANENTLYEFDLDSDPDAVLVKMDGLVLKAASNFLVSPVLQQSFLPSFPYSLLWLQSSFVGNEGTIFDTEQQSTDALVTWSSNSPFDDNRNLTNWFFTADANVTVTFKGTFAVTLRNGAYVRLYIKNSNGTRTVLFTLNGSEDPAGEVITQTYTINQPLTLATGEKLYLISELFDITSPNASAEYTVPTPFSEISFAIQYDSRYITTYVKALPCFILFKRIIEKLSEGRFEAFSSLLASRYDLVCTCGDALRGLDGSKIKTSLSQFFDSFNAILNIALGVINDKFQLEKKEYWFDYTDIIQIDHVNTLRVSSANDFIYNTIKSGSPNQDYDNVNGKDEPNTTQVWTTPITKVVKELSLVSPYRLDMYGAEFTRINLQGKKTTDSSSDNDTFVLQVNKLPLNDTGFVYYTLDRTLNAGATGLVDPASAFNLGLSPKHILLTHGWFLHSFLDKVDDQYIKYQTSDKNAEMVTDVIEKEDVQIGLLPAQKFLPVIFEIDVAVPEGLQSLLNINPVRAYQFTYSGITLKGIALKTAIQPGENKAQTYQLLSTSDNDLAQLINFID